MSLTLRTDFGCTEAVIDDDCGLKRFYEVANILSDDLDVNFNHKTDEKPARRPERTGRYRP